MCTVTVHQTSEKLLVTMNRDEARTRAPEVPPLFHNGALPWIAPADSQRGGTWIAVNECGVAACLMNGYLPGEAAAVAPPEPRQSRGAIIPWLMPQGDLSAMRTAIESRLDPASFPSFTLLLADRAGLETYTWTGSDAFTHVSHRADWSFFTSSSWNRDAVLAWRADAFELWRENGCATRESIPTIHLLQPADKREWATLVDRERTCTRSITQIDIGDNATMRYWPREAIDRAGAPSITELPLRAACLQP